MRWRRRWGWVEAPAGQISEAGGTKYVSILWKMQHASASTPHISMLEKWSVRLLLWSEVRGLMTTPCLHARTLKVMFSSWMWDFYFVLLIPRFAITIPLRRYTTRGYVWLNWTFLALVYHILAPRGTSGWSLPHTNTSCYTKTERWKWKNIICHAGSWGGGGGGVLSYLRVFNPLSLFNPLVKGMQLMG